MSTASAYLFRLPMPVSFVPNQPAETAPREPSSFHTRVSRSE